MKRQRPDWWPDNEPWPPREPHWRRMRFFWPAVLAMGVVTGLLIAGCLAVFWLGMMAAGPPAGPGPHLPERPTPVIFRVFGTIIGVLFIVAFIRTIIALRRVSQPATVWLDAAHRVENSDYSVRVPEQGPRQLRMLGRAFNAMTARLQSDEERRRKMLADITHELRTPLTVIQGQVEAIVDGVYPADEAHLTPILDETRVLSRLIEDLRTLSLAESGGLKLNREPTDLGILAAEVAAAFQRQAEAAGVRLDARVGELPLVEIDPVRVQEVLSNLVANALRYTPSGGAIHIAGTVSGGHVVLQVVDTGTGIAPEDLPHIFDRFYRSADSGGTGLGLPIARDLAEAHGGSLEAASTVGTGTTMTLRLPLPENGSSSPS